MNCKCKNWCGQWFSPFHTHDGTLIPTNHHPNCTNYNDSLIDVWKVSFGLRCCYFDNEKEAKDMAVDEGQGVGVGGVIEITKEKMHREVFENLPEFEGF